jgi:glutathione peroxidase-family protein
MREQPLSAFSDITMDSITGDSVSFNQYDGQVSLIVNVASA